MATLQTLPGDDVRQIMWRFTDRFDFQMLVQSARSVARGPVARLVASGARNSHDWTEAKNSLLSALDEAGITTAFLEPSYGGYIEGPKNFAMGLIAFELAWVDAGAATVSMAANLALAPIHEKGTEEQKQSYMSRCVPAQNGENRDTLRGAFVLTEPLPFVGVDTGVLSGKVSISEWEDGHEPMLLVEKRGRFITNMDYANFVTVAVNSNDECIKGSCLIILEENDPGEYDRGAPTLKLVHQLSSTRDPIFRMTVPASRIVGGYTIKDGVIIPNSSHSDVIESVFRRTRVTVAPMSSAKLLSAVEPIIRYQRSRFRGGGSTEPGKPRYELGLQLKEDVLLRLVSVWATGEASTSLGFQTTRRLDEFDLLEKKKIELFQAEGISGGRKELMALKKKYPAAIEVTKILSKPAGERDENRLKALLSDDIVQYILAEADVNVLTPASKLWNTGHGANMMREAVSLMGGYGITEDCPGFLGQKWMDLQLEATYEGPEAVQRRQLSVTMTSEVFLAQFNQMIKEMRQIASDSPDSGACALGTAMQLWLWTLNHLRKTKDDDGKLLYHSKRQGITFPLADALCCLLSARAFLLDVMELQEKGPVSAIDPEGLKGYIAFFMDLSHVQCAWASGEVSRIAAMLVHGYHNHPEWNNDSVAACFNVDELDDLDGMVPGISSCAMQYSDVVPEGEDHPVKRGPCAKIAQFDTFNNLRIKLDGCLSGFGLAKDRAARAVTEVMIPEALDYPL